jgi:hypothetical protein
LEIDPLNSAEPKPKTTSWILVLALLLGFPLLLSFGLTQWLGVADEDQPAAGIFERLALNEVPMLEFHSLHYGHLFFARLRLKPEGVKPFYDQLEGKDTSHGRAEPPIALKLEREWWDPKDTDEGTYWRYDNVTLWSPDGHPDLLYGVTREGDANEGAKNAK